MAKSKFESYSIYYKVYNQKGVTVFHGGRSSRNGFTDKNLLKINAKHKQCNLAWLLIISILLWSKVEKVLLSVVISKTYQSIKGHFW